mgnify:CR=1 FL=1
MRQAGYNSRQIKDTRWVQNCIAALENDIKRFDLGGNYLYDGAKYFHRSYEYYRDLEWNCTPRVFKPINKDNRCSAAFNMSQELFETGKHISVDIFSDEYMDKINAIQLPNTKIKLLQRLLSQAIEEYKKVNRIMSMEFAERMKRVVDEYNNRRKDEAFANEVLDDVAEQLAKLLEDLKKEKDSFKDMGIDYEEKAFYDILNIVARKYEFEYPDDKMIELSKRIKLIVDDKARYTDWSTRDDIKANLQVDLILLLDEFDYPPVTIDDVYKEVLEQAEDFKKYAN